MDQWSDTKRFWAESARTAVFGVLGAAAATFLLNTYADSDKTVRDIRVHAVERFLIDSNIYSSAAWDRRGNRQSGGRVPVYTVPIWGPERDFRPTPAVVFDTTQFPWAHF
jgi:hypothetical protein